MLRLWLSVLLLLPLAGTAAELAGECIDEPVFNGSVCVYQANPRAASSVLLVHGVNGSARFDWERQIPALAEGYHVVAVDLPGFGASSKGRKAYTPDNYAQLLEFIAGRYIDRPHTVVGHSMGAVVALRYAARYAGPDLGRVVLIDAAGILHGVAISKALAGSYASRFGDNAFSAFIARLTGKLLEGLEGMPVSPDDLLAKHPNLWMRNDPAATAALAVAAADMSYDIATVGVPTLILWGEDDHVAPLRTGQVLEARLADARLVVLPRAGHAPMREQAAQVNALLNEHLAHTGGRSGRARGAQEAPTPHTAERVGHCRNQRDVTFSGHYRRIELRHCDRVTIRDAHVGAIDAFESRLNIIDSEIASDGTAVTLEGSEVVATASRIAGDVAIDAARSRLDLAGVELVGHTAAVVARTTTNIVFSVSTLASPHHSGYRHGFHELSNDRL